ncbi:DUF4846 domain-containing protein [Hyphomicrobium sp.]|uniref:DUF4846 domain-containing protein n=1 Tax=Hyphomicrobium sp. TaxID=82 RepID=UPI002FDF0AE1
MLDETDERRFARLGSDAILVSRHHANTEAYPAGIAIDIVGAIRHVAAMPRLHASERRMRDRPAPLVLSAILLVLAAVATAAAAPATKARTPYGWRASDAAPAETLAERIAPPPGFTRTPAADGSFAAWLRGLPLRSAGAPVLLHTGKPKWRQDVHAAVVDIDVGPRDLQQCADAIMRLRAEWLYSLGRDGEIAFNDTDGKRRRFSSAPRKDHAGLRKYMDLVFAYAGTYSLERELKPVAADGLAIGHVFIKGGFPGHAVLVVDMVENRATGERRFLLLQSYMPAQDMHILKNPNASDGSPWYATPVGDQLVTPEWSFPRTALRRWP